MARQRAPMMAGGPRGIRPRMPNGMQNVQNRPQQPGGMVKRTPEQIQALQAKRKRMDVLLPNKNEDPDCQVVALLPKNTDDGLPQIQSIQVHTYCKLSTQC